MGDVWIGFSTNVPSINYYSSATAWETLLSIFSPNKSTLLVFVDSTYTFLFGVDIFGVEVAGFYLGLSI